MQYAQIFMSYFDALLVIVSVYETAGNIISESDSNSPSSGSKSYKGVSEGISSINEVLNYLMNLFISAIQNYNLAILSEKMNNIIDEYNSLGDKFIDYFFANESTIRREEKLALESYYFYYNVLGRHRSGFQRAQIYIQRLGFNLSLFPDLEDTFDKIKDENADFFEMDGSAWTSWSWELDKEGEYTGHSGLILSQHVKGDGEEESGYVRLNTEIIIDANKAMIDMQNMRRQFLLTTSVRVKVYESVAQQLSGNIKVHSSQLIDNQLSHLEAQYGVLSTQIQSIASYSKMMVQMWNEANNHRISFIKLNDTF